MRRLRASRSFGDCRHEVLIDHGNVRPMISVMVEKQEIALIVIGTHGRRGLEKLRLGSTPRRFCGVQGLQL